MVINKFTPEVIESLGWYVYILTNPLNNDEVFYVGKGCGNRIFAHVNDQLKAKEGGTLSVKLETIRQIHEAGLEVGHGIVSYNLRDETEAFAVESALINVYPNLTNAVKGHGNKFGIITAQEAQIQYGAEEAVLEDDVLIIKINNSYGKMDTYDVVRFSWPININRAMKAKVVLAVANGIVRGVYEVDYWKPATPENFPELYRLRNVVDAAKESTRKAFSGRVASEPLYSRYINKSLSPEYSLKGSQKSIRYNYDN
ncbi:endonuclease [Serratia phage vB_SmaS-Totoro]|nr:endonuclease [Serratia phage vB_SmaS-Totoro]